MRPSASYRWVTAPLCLLVLTTSARAFILNSNDPAPWTTTASGTRPGNGAPATITWSIIPDGTSMSTASAGGTTTSNLISFLDGSFGGNPAQSNLALQPWFHIFTDSFGRWNQLGGVNFIFEPNDDGVFHPSANGQLGVRGDIRLGGFNIDGPNGTLAFTYVPTGGSDLAIDTSESSLFTSGANLNYVYFRDTLMHEIGHAFGLEHVSTNEAATGKLLMEPFIDSSPNPIDGPQLDEVRGVQFYFGDANEKLNGGLGNGTPARATSLGPLAPGSTKLIGTSADVPTQTISPTATDFVSISNAGDTDIYSFTISQPESLNATLTPRGGVFSQGAADQGQTPTTFNANARNNLALAALGTNGTSVLASSDASPAGGNETIANLLIPSAGTYYVRVTGADNTIQLYELALSAAPTLLGDYNRNGVVDAADYVLWRNSLGQSVVAGTGADGNFDGQVTQADYDVWRTHFGQTSSGAGVGSEFNRVPEPSAGALALLLVGCFWPGAEQFFRAGCRTRALSYRLVDRSGTTVPRTFRLAAERQ